MGYGVGFQGGRWIGYSVPAECDWPDCHEMIDHGMGYQCEQHYVFEENEDGDDVEIEDEGCDLYFCEEHLYKTSKHDTIQAKPDHPKWSWWLMNHKSWDQWRLENPAEAQWHEENAKLYTPDAEMLEELADAN